MGGCCVSGGSSGRAKCFDRSSEQCCGTVSEMPVVCGLAGGCPSSSFSYQCPAASTVVTTTTSTPAPRKTCRPLEDAANPWNFTQEYDPETEQCCGEGVYGTPTVCSKDMGCCVSGGSSGRAKCFDRSSEQCCGTVSEMPVICGLAGGCPSSSLSYQCPEAVALFASANSSSSDEISHQILLP